MPARSKKQQRFMGAELARARAGKKTRTGMSAKKLRVMARKPKGKKLPLRVRKKKR
jgi:hypothetical protein